jgi:hypothetical protein
MSELQGIKRSLKYNQVREAYRNGEMGEDDYQWYLREINFYQVSRRNFDKGLIGEHELTIAGERVRGLRFIELK